MYIAVIEYLNSYNDNVQKIVSKSSEKLMQSSVQDELNKLGSSAVRTAYVSYAVTGEKQKLVQKWVTEEEAAKPIKIEYTPSSTLEI